MKSRLVLGLLGILFLPKLASALVNDNLIVNAGFATDLSSWNSVGQVSWSNQDANGSISSGSAHVNSYFYGSSAVDQCVALPGIGPFDVGGTFFIGAPEDLQEATSAQINLSWYTNSSCSGTSSSGPAFVTPVPVPLLSWTPVTGYKVMPPAGSLSVDVAFSIVGPPEVGGLIDNTFFRLTACTPSDQDLCLNGGRFRVTAQWESTTNGGVGHGVQFNDESGYFWFFDPNNTEVVVKVHNACIDPFNHYWVFAAGLTNVLVTLDVEDTALGYVKYYINPEGTAFLPLQDTSAFETCP